MPRTASPVADLWLGAILIAICAAALWETRDIPPGTFEPLGSAPVPQAVASLVILLTLVVMARAWSRLRAGIHPEGDAVAPRVADALAIGALTVVYTLALQFRIGRFDVLTSVYLFVVIGLLVRFRARSLPGVTAVALFTGFGCQYVFTQVFIVDLPGAF